MSQSTQLPWRRRCTLDSLFHCKGRPGVILGSPIEQCIYCARCYVSESICTVTDGGYYLAFSHGATAYALDRCQDDTLLLQWNGYVMELLLLWMIPMQSLCMIELSANMAGLGPSWVATLVGEWNLVMSCTDVTHC